MFMLVRFPPMLVPPMSPEPSPLALERRRRRPALPLILSLLGLGAGVMVPSGATCAGDDPGSTSARTVETGEPLGERPRQPLVRLGRADAWFGLATAIGVGAAAFADHELRERALATDGDGARRLARGAEHLGSPEVVGTAILVGYVAGRALGRPALAGASARVGIPVAAAAVAAGAIKLAIGRVRPEDAAGESHPYQPFSGHDSFPSGHAALAFATATALDRETRAGWVPWVAYPLAALVGWSRVRDDKHWTSDVVAGAALGAWTAAKTYDAVREWEGRSGRLGIQIDGRGGALRTAVRFSY